MAEKRQSPRWAGDFDSTGRPLFQAATANLDPTTEAKADKGNPERGPMLVVSGGATGARSSTRR